MSVFSVVDARNAIVTEVTSLWSSSTFKDVALHGNNGPKAQLDQLREVVNYEIEFGPSEQVTIANDPIDRTWGNIEFYFGVREGKGLLRPLQMQAFVKQELKARTLASVKTLIPSAGRQEKAVGWVFETLYVPFYFDSYPIGQIKTP